MKRSHFLFGAATGVLIAHQLTQPLVICGVVGGISGLLPDVDHPNSTVGKLLPRWWHRLTPGHRGPTHSIFWCALVGLLVAYASSFVTGGFEWGLGSTLVFAGALSHLVADGMTTHGVPLMWPLQRRKYHLLGPFRFDTGGWQEAVATTVVVVSAFWWVALR